MRIETLSCENCGTVVAANVLEGERVMKCPGLDCESVLAFEDLPRETQRWLLDKRDRYRM
jgi:hypothetical protein